MTLHPIESSSERVFREDVLLFFNGCFAATAQAGFYRSARTQRLGIEFLHEYMLHSYREIYGLTLAVGINDFNTALILRLLLTFPRVGVHHPLENELIRAALADLPPQRVYRLFRALRRSRVNNRRTRAVIRDYVSTRDRWELDAMKYRAGLSSAARHAHLTLPAEIGDFVFAWKKQKRFERPLLEAWRAAHYSKDAIYRLPFTVAEGFANKHGVSRQDFLKKIAPQMTRGEQERLARNSAAHKVDLKVDHSKMALLRLATLVLSLPFEQRRERREELERALTLSARRTLTAPPSPSRVAIVLDDSHSSRGTRVLAKRPLAVALGSHYLLTAAFPAAQTFWVHGPALQDAHILVRPRGQTDTAGALVRALKTQPELVFIISDGWDNDPPGSTAAVIELYHQLDPDCVFVHGNPVFDGLLFEPRSFGKRAVTVGIREPKDLLTSLSFARFSLGQGTAAELAADLETRARHYLKARHLRQERRRSAP